MTSNHSVSSPDLAQLDALTGGAFTAATSGERAACLRAWLAGDPPQEQLQAVYKELSVKDKGAAKLLRERLDDLRRAKNQEAMAEEWASKGQTLLAASRFHVADALAWQRDAAKAGAPLGREPLSVIKSQLNERVKAVDDLQHRVQVQREAAVLLAQRIEVLSTKSWLDAQAALEGLRTDVLAWQAQADALLTDPNWNSVDLRFPPQLDTSRGQLELVWQAFSAALAQATAAQADASAPLPQVPVWADELRLARGEAVAELPVKPQVPPEVIEQAVGAVRQALQTLELEVAQGHGKATPGAANALRQALKEHGRHIDNKLDKQAHAALSAASELEGWQRWRANQLREELVAKAEALLNRPEGQALGGRKMQETLRGLREQWKQTDQGGPPNHGLWKRFDEACNQAHKVVEAWLEKVRTEAAEHRASRLALIEELKGWSAQQSVVANPDWKAVNRDLHKFAERWRDAGHLGEKQFAELQPLWKAAMAEASAPLAALQKESLSRRHTMVDEAVSLGAAPTLRIDAIKALQQRWQVEAHAVPLERRQEQKLWDAFRKPIDEAFNRKTAAREQAVASMNERDRRVLQAAKALEQANAAGDAQAIRAAMDALVAAQHSEAHATQDGASPQVTGGHETATTSKSSVAKDRSDSSGAPAADAPTADTPVASDVVESGEVKADTKVEGSEPAQALSVTVPSAEAPSAETPSSETPAAEPAKPAPAPRRPVVAVRGDDRPGMKKTEAAPSDARGPRSERGRDRGNDRRNEPGADRGAQRGTERGTDRFSDRAKDRGPGRMAEHGAPRTDRSEAPRLGDAAFRAQRDALEHAQAALRKLAAQAHGEALTRLLEAWQSRAPDTLPTAQELGGKVTPVVRTAWAQAISKPVNAQAADTALLRLEMAAEVPTPASELEARRALQLQLLTRRNDPSPAQTWAQDVASVLAGQYQESGARRLQAALKVMLRR